LENKDCILIGLNLDLIIDNKKDIKDPNKNAEDYVFSISFQKEYFRSDFFIDRDYFDDDKWICIPLNRKYLIEDVNIDLLKKQIKDIIKEVFLENIDEKSK